ncbi:response regulator, partial [Streptomyces sp. NPDC005180]|uniref:response regulator n=1 Tax=Streptomyces sp. NPDC005180 TaxID=3156868 RepID=UPI0033A2C6E6
MRRRLSAPSPTRTRESPSLTLVINLKARGFEADTATDGARALRLAGEFAPDVILLDLGLPDMDGIDVLHALR